MDGVRGGPVVTAARTHTSDHAIEHRWPRRQGDVRNTLQTLGHFAKLSLDFEHAAVQDEMREHHQRVLLDCTTPNECSEYDEDR
jgi:hypothetical protein